jgi:hypothetical protein
MLWQVAIDVMACAAARHGPLCLGIVPLVMARGKAHGADAITAVVVWHVTHRQSATLQGARRGGGG